MKLAKIYLIGLAYLIAPAAMIAPAGFGDLNEFHSSGLAVEFVLTASAIFVLRRVANEISPSHV